MAKKRSEEAEQGLEARLQKYRRGEDFDTLLLCAKGGIYMYGI